MKELLEYILNTVIDSPDIKVEETDMDGVTVFKIYAPQDQIGRIIGKGGKTINALKNILKIRAVREEKKIDIQVEPLQEG